MRLALPLILALTMTASAADKPQIPAGYWPLEESERHLAKTETIRLDPDLSSLTADEKSAVDDLLDAGQIFQRLYELSRHHQALAAHEKLLALDKQLGSPKRTQNLIQLYRLWQGPIASTLENARQPFLPVDPQKPARNVYPLDATKEELDAFLAKNPARRGEILGERTVVRRATRANLDRDLATLAANPGLALLHPELTKQLKAQSADAKAFYAVPHSVAYAKDLTAAYRKLMSAASKIEPTDAELARYLRNRGRDLLSNDYESGDASWVTGHFKKLYAQIGAYETYDDALYGVKAFHSFSLMIANEPATADLRKKLGGLQAIEDALPYDHKKRIREDIPVGVYHVIDDFGQARGTNTATILPNDALFSRRYGRTIMLRENIMKHPDIFASAMRTWRTATADAHGDDLASEGNFQRTLWHEVGHYLGADRDRQGRTLDVALEDYADAIEEMKADLVSLFGIFKMHREGTVSDATLRAVQASGIARTLQNVKPRPDQPYQTMQLVQFNWFRDQGLITPDPQTARLAIDYGKYQTAVDSLLRETLALQYNGDKAAAAKFFEQWTTWTPEVHDKLAARIREAQGARYRIVRYGALGE
jgi:hypothetical protein